MSLDEFAQLLRAANSLVWLGAGSALIWRLIGRWDLQRPIDHWLLGIMVVMSYLTSGGFAAAYKIHGTFNPVNIPFLLCGLALLWVIVRWHHLLERSPKAEARYQAELARQAKRKEPKRDTRSELGRGGHTWETLAS